MTNLISGGTVKVNDFAVRTIQISPALPGPPGTGVKIDTAVDSYGGLPKNLGQDDQGYTAVVAEDGLLYVWTGSKWPDKGKGAPFRGLQGIPGISVKTITTNRKGTGLIFTLTSGATTEVPVPVLDKAVEDAQSSADKAHVSARQAGESAQASEESSVESSKQRERAEEQATLTSTDRADTLNAKTDVYSARDSINATHTQSSEIAAQVKSDSLSATDAASKASVSEQTSLEAAQRAQDNADLVSSAVSEAQANAQNTQLNHDAVMNAEQRVQEYVAKAQDLALQGVPNATDEQPGVITLPGGESGVLGGTSDRPRVAGWSSKADLDGEGKVLASQIPKIALNETVVVASTKERLAIRTLEDGDMAIQTQEPGKGSYILQGDPSLEDSWIPLSFADSGVVTLNGQSGDVVMTQTDLGLGKVDNTADMDKPVSQATLDALETKVNTTRTVSADKGLIGGGSLASDVSMGVDFGTTEGSVCAGNDPRLSDNRKPLKHDHKPEEIVGLSAQLSDKVTGQFEIKVTTSAPAAGTANSVLTFRTG